LLLAYPVAYYVTGYAGRRQGLLLVALLAPFWVSYMMRMLAWVNLLEADGMVNRLLVGIGVLGEPFPWPASRSPSPWGSSTATSPTWCWLSTPGWTGSTSGCWRRPATWGPAAAAPSCCHPAPVPPGHPGRPGGDRPAHVGDYFTNDLLSGSPRTSMVGNLVNDAIASPGQGGQAAALVLIMIVLLAVPMLGYIRSTGRAAREAGR
jgi:ABC-type spermidine/putrescine transport system permease subunit I